MRHRLRRILNKGDLMATAASKPCVSAISILQRRRPAGFASANLGFSRKFFPQWH
jgi:hypothetical protein